MPIVINLDVELAKKKMSVADFAAAIDITPANVSVLKNGRAKAVRFSTLDAICRVLDCQPGDIFSWVPEPEAPTEAGATGTRA
jgi:putative transcriptional regulator